MFQITYSHYDHKVKEEKGKHFIWDGIRKKWIQLTPEEWVRQNFIQYLIQDKNYPKAKIAVEKQIITHENKSRFDIVIYDEKMKPWMIVECKNQNISLDDKVIQQILNYQSIVQCKYLIVTNGNEVAGWKINECSEVITEMPKYC
jgi:hypothetical protein